MRRSLQTLSVLLGTVAWIAACTGQTAPEPTVTLPAPTVTMSPAEAAQDRLHWFGTASFLYSGGKTIYFDPVSLEGDLPTADIILISHKHSDHWDPAEIRKVLGPDTVVLVSPNVFAESTDDCPDLGVPVTVVLEGETVDVEGVTVRGVPAYDIQLHPKGSGGLGYVVGVDGLRIYFAGGTNYYPEMADINSDIAIYPVYSKQDLEQVVGELPARVMIFMHTSSAGASAFATLFASQMPDTTFISLEAGPYAR
jgi:L-ascorbate metabolism protein UlaG (beta-lactamase superfamily)